ncbi:hypothetical protein C5167_043910 [Papaver somniferum]|uniref:Uncharacterized protein n=1 Tax=Papaver somniferum TaxID=3469 RepID=A0A4Y7LAZ2_PAPSO|nr:hypothetical protein C5167_043910 [Papaver somniferum]
MENDELAGRTSGGGPFVKMNSMPILIKGFPKL